MRVFDLGSAASTWENVLLCRSSFGLGRSIVLTLCTPSSVRAVTLCQLVLPLQFLSAASAVGAAAPWFAASVKKSPPPTDFTQYRMEELREIFQSKRRPSRCRAASTLGCSVRGNGSVVATRLNQSSRLPVGRMVADRATRLERVKAIGRVAYRLGSAEKIDCFIELEGERKLVRELSRGRVSIDLFAAAGLSPRTAGLSELRVRHAGRRAFQIRWDLDGRFKVVHYEPGDRERTLRVWPAPVTF